jgi:hypothetical protein
VREPDGQAARSGHQIDVSFRDGDVRLTRAGAQRHRTVRDVDLEVATAARHDEPMAQVSEPDRSGPGLDLRGARDLGHPRWTAAIPQPEIAVDVVELGTTRSSGDVRIAGPTFDDDIGAVADDLGRRPGGHHHVDVHGGAAHPAADQLENASELGRVNDQRRSVHVDPDAIGQIGVGLRPPRAHCDDGLGQIVARMDRDRA